MSETSMRAGDAALADDGFAGRAMFLVLPAVAMSLGWGLRGTIGGGQIGAMIPGAIVALCLCHLLGWSRSVGVAAAFGAVGVGLGGQETYGQTIGFVREPETLLWGAAGLTIKGAMWGLAGGALVGLGLMRRKYRHDEIVIGLLLMIVGAFVGWMYVDHPKLVYFSNRLDRPREEIWVGLTLGGTFLVAWLAALRKETVSLGFAWRGTLAGGAGFGIGGLFIAMGDALPEPYQGWPWWKVMEFTFGALFGLGLGAACYRFRHELREQDIPDDSAASDDLNILQTLLFLVACVALVVGGLSMNSQVRFRASYTIVGSILIACVMLSNRLSWQVALGMTICGFCRDFVRRAIEFQWLDREYRQWTTLLMIAIPVVIVLELTRRKGRLTAASALLALTWLATLFGLVKVCIADKAGTLEFLRFVPAVFVVEAIATTLLVRPAPYRG